MDKPNPIEALRLIDSLADTLIRAGKPVDILYIEKIKQLASESLPIQEDATCQTI